MVDVLHMIKVVTFRPIVP